MFSFRAGNPLYDLGQLYILILFARAIISWFPVNYDSPLNGVRRILFMLTEPVLAPFRKVIPPVGNLDVSFFVAFVVIEVLVQAVLARLPI